MKILLITSKRLTGLNYHRQIVPFTNLDIDAQAFPEWDFNFTDEFIKEFQCVSFLRSINLYGRTLEIVERINKLGLKVHFDIDDYWVIPSKHPLYAGYKEQKIEVQTIEALKNADFITTTTEYLAQRIKEYNENVYVLPNSINPEETQWQHVEVKNDKVRFGYIAGVHHNKDVELLHPNLVKLHKDNSIYDKFQLCVAGFNINAFPDGKKELNPYYKWVEQVFTDNYKYVKEAGYKEYLKHNNPEQNELTDMATYRRLWGLDTFNYGKLYNFIDVSLVPLHETMFSANKSELKLIEAGFMKKAVIVSDVKPYNILANDNNSLLIKSTRNHIDWFIAIKKLINEPNLRNDLAEQLYEDVKVKYHIETVNVERKQIFERCVLA
jgi:glycosyltransferase involved in cell wall biosynthesis